MKKKTIILAYSGGLDTSITIPWLKEKYECEVIAYTANLGQIKQEDIKLIQKKAIDSGAKNAIVEDVTSEFIEEYVWKMLKASAKYEGTYLMGTISRYIIAKKLTEVANKYNAEAVCHGATGKGNDQVRFELSIMSNNPKLEIIAPWRIWDIKSREDAIDYAMRHGVPITATKDKPFSTDENIWYMSHEGGILEDCKNESPESIYEFTQHPKFSSDNDEVVSISFEKGIPVGINGDHCGGVEILEKLNLIGKKHGIGCLDIVENRVVGMKSRGVYEFPGGEIIYQAHKMLESITIDRDTMHYKNKISLDYADLVYDGKWFSELRVALDQFVDSTQKTVSGEVKVKLYKGSIFPVSIDSKYSLFKPDLAGFTMGDEYDQNDAKGFINIFGLPLKVKSLTNE